MPALRMEALDFPEPGDSPIGSARAIVAQARAITTRTFAFSVLSAGPVCFSVFLRRRRGNRLVTVELGDSTGREQTTVELSDNWTRHDITYSAVEGRCSAKLFLGEPGVETPILSDCLYAHPQAESGTFASSPIPGSELPPKHWAIYDSVQRALLSRGAADAAGGFPLKGESGLEVTHGAVLLHPSNQFVAVEMTPWLLAAAHQGSAPHPVNVGVLGSDWSGCTPLPLSTESMRDATEAFAWPDILGPDGLPAGAGSRLVVEASDAMRRLVSTLNDRPEDLRSMDDRKFEELVAHLLERDGFEVQLQPRSGRGRGDDGIDVFALRRSAGARFLMGVQCKRHAKKNTVRGSVLRDLIGSLDIHHLDRGVVVTTSTFQPQAVGYERLYEGRPNFDLDLVDYARLSRWLGQYA